MSAAEPVCQFVPSVGSAALRLDLNSPTSGLRLGSGYRFDPPPLKRSVISTLLADGDRIPASAYGNREIVLPLNVLGSSPDTLATRLRALHYELNREQNVLKWQPSGATVPVFFRTFRAPDYSADYSWLWDTSEPVLRIPAEPFAYGNRVDLTPAVVTNDPAAATNPLYVGDIDVLGDVETPLYATLDPTTSGLFTNDLTFAVSRDDGRVLFAQAEAGTMGVDTTTPGHDALMSGSGNNYTRTSFATTSGLVQRMTTAQIPSGLGASSSLYRGRYRVFLVARASTLDGFTVRLNVVDPVTDANVVTGDSVSWSASITANRQVIDLGTFALPVGQDPPGSGFAARPVVKAPKLRIDVGRSGAGSFDMDYVMLFPADEATLILNTSRSLYQTGLLLVVDGPNDQVYGLAGGALVPSAGLLPMEGQVPMLQPGTDSNRLFLLRSKHTSGGTVTDAITDQTTVSPFYWPRYLVV